MITSICLDGKHHIGMDSYGRFELKGLRISKKRVPFVRYRFESYGVEELQYIKGMQEKFSMSAHMAEITIREDVKEQLEAVRSLGNVARFVYLDIYDEDVATGLSDGRRELVKLLIGEDFDRLMVRDRSTTLFTVAADRLRKEIQGLGVKIPDIGICQSPLSTNGNQCLSAVKAREIAAKYGAPDDMPLPTANHEGSATCGCIRYQLIQESISAPGVEKKAMIVNVAKEKRVAKEKKEATVKKRKNVLVKW